ncbi:MAG: hypothetical protein ACPG5T_00850 [Endozoicomonas sp.]
MSNQPKQPEPAQVVAAPPQPSQPDQPLKPAASNDLASIRDHFDPTKYNPIQHTQAVMDCLPSGCNLVPYVVSIPTHEKWDKSKASFLKTGEAMVAATAIKRIGRAAGIHLKRTIDEVVEVNGNSYLRIEYEATMMLPDGEVITETGGKEEAYSGAHAREKIDTKAKRNAIRQLLNIPITLPTDQLEKPFVIFKPVYQRGVDQRSDKILDAIEAKKDRGLRQLYGGTEEDVVDVQVESLASANTDGELTFDGLVMAFEMAQDLGSLDKVRLAAEEVPMTKAQRDTAGEVYKSCKTALEATAKF